MSKELTIQLDAKENRLTVKSLTEAFEKALAFLRGIDQSGEWEVVEISKRSPLRLKVRNRDPESTAKLSGFMKQMRGLQKKPDKVPRLTNEAILGTRELATVLDDGISGVRLSVGRARAIEFTPQIVEAMNRHGKPGKEFFHEWTTVRGMLDQITAHGDATKFRIEDQVTGAFIPCSFSKEQLERIKKALPHRVEVFGRAKVSRVKGVAAIEVESVRRLPDNGRRIDALPRVNITGKMSSSEYLERVRNGG